MNKIILALCLLMLIGGSATAQDAEVWTISGKPLDAVWDAALSALEAVGLPVLSVDRASGLVVSDWMTLKKKDGYSKCGSVPFPQVPFDRGGKVTIRVKVAVDDAIEVEINASFRQSYGYKTPEKTRTCESTGTLEKKVTDAMKKKLGL